jgi:hypothetical protein
MHDPRTVTVVGVFLVTGLVGAGPATAHGHDKPVAPTAAKQEGRVDQQADVVLRRMSSYMGSLKTLRVDTTTIDEKVTSTGLKVQEIKVSKVTMARPNKIAVDRTGPYGQVLFRYDGKQFAVYGASPNAFATAPAPPTIDAAIDQARDRYGIDAPGGDLLVTDVYAGLADGVTEGHYIGLEPVDGVMTHHLAMRKANTDYQIWIQDGPQPVPVRYVITSRDVAGAPQFAVELRNFQPNVPVSDASFALVPPPTAKRIVLGNRPRSHM